MAKNYDSIVGAFTAQALSARNFPESEKVFSAICQIYKEFSLDNASLTLAWFSPANRKAVANIVDSDVQEDILRAFDVLAAAREAKIDGRYAVVVDRVPVISH
ncbi:MAG: hypothetical protein R3E13_11215 [Alphaproteobacteria bacterium]